MLTGVFLSDQEPSIRRRLSHAKPWYSDPTEPWVRAFNDVEDRAKVISLAEIEAEDWTLNISRYAIPPVAEDIPSLPEAVATIRMALAEARAAGDKVRDVLTTRGWLK